MSDALDAARRIFYGREEEVPAFSSPQEMYESLLVNARDRFRFSVPREALGPLYQLCESAFSEPVFLRFSDKQLLDGQEEFLQKLFGENLWIVLCDEKRELRGLVPMVNEWTAKYLGLVGLEIVHTQVARAVVLLESEYCQLGGPVFRTLLGHRENRSLYFRGYERLHISVAREMVEVR